MRKAIISVAAIALLGSASLALADDSGHATPGSLKGEQADQKGTTGDTTLNRMGGEGSSQGDNRASATENNMNTSK